MNTKVAILGKLETKFKAPFDNPEWDIWTLNYQCELPRVTLLFDIHEKSPNPKANITRQNYPFELVELLLDGQYFNNSISYMIAYAIINGYKEISLYGMRFYTDNEHRREEYQNVRELIFFAKGNGIKITAPYDEVMLKEYEYYGI